MPACGCPDITLADGTIQKCQCDPCSSGDIQGCACNKATGCACQSATSNPDAAPKACICGSSCSCLDCPCGKATNEAKTNASAKNSCCC